MDGLTFCDDFVSTRSLSATRRLEPFVALTRCYADHPVIRHRFKAKKRGRNRRMHFKHCKTHKVNCNKHLDHIGFASSLEDEGPESNHGFSEPAIAWSSMKARQAAKRMADCAPLDHTTCFSIPVHGCGDMHIFRVIPLPRRKIRVLSLFDGIGSAYYILAHKLRLSIQIYFSCEVSSDALMLLKYLYHGKIVHLGSVKDVGSDLLHSLGPIDLLIGGSPCDNLSRVNPRRMGLFDENSSGNLFFDFIRIRSVLSTYAMKRQEPFLWLFENTCHLDKKVRDTMTRFLGCQPVKCCSSSFLPMKRARLFWGNIPHMSEAATEMSSLKGKSLQDVIRPFREATVGCLPTLTTNRSSHKVKGGALPVSECGVPAALTINEIEAVFGFPPHYTDCGNLSVTRRHRLLGKAWCVPVVARLLHVLQEMYEVETEPM